MPTVLYRAPVVCTMAGPPLTNGGVLVEGARIVAVGDAVLLAGDADRVHVVDGVILPGLVNAATCLEQADAGTLAVGGPQHLWGPAVSALTGTWDADQWSRSARRGVQQVLRGGAVTCGDVVVTGPAVPAAGRAGLLGDSWVAVAGVDAPHADAVLAQVQAALALPVEGRRVGIAAFPAELGIGVLRSLAALAVDKGVPLHLPAGRSASEAAAVQRGEGPLADRARAAGLAYEWLDGGTGLTPVRYLDACGALVPGTSVAHAVVADVLETRLLADRGVTVVCCPRADDLLRAGQAPLERFAEAGVRLALGTASPAASPGLDMLAEARAWAELARARGLGVWTSAEGMVSLEEQAVRLATVDGARAMGWGHLSGVLEAGRRADLVGLAVRTTARDAYRDLIEGGAGRQVLTVVGGVRKARRDDAGQPWPPIEVP